MIKIFLSQGMANRSDDEILEERHRCTEALRYYFKKEIDEDIEIIDFIITEDPPEGANAGCWYLGKSIEMMSQADYVAFLPRFQAYRGCKIERYIAAEYNICPLYFDAEGHLFTVSLYHLHSKQNDL